MPRSGTSTTPTPAELQAQAAWDEKNNKALGAIELYIAQDLRHLIDGEFLAAITWKKIMDEYVKPGVMGVYVAFQQFINTQISDVSGLSPQIDSIIEKAVQVNKAGIVISEQLVALIVVNSLPKSYQLLNSTILTTINLTTLKLATVQPKIVEEEQRCLANKVSILRVLKALQLSIKCEKCGRNNHTTEQH